MLHSFRTIFTSAALAALVAGLLLTLVQQYKVIPSILQAETYEQTTAASANHTHEKSAGHVHEKEAWAPEDGWQRTFFTFAANVMIAMGFALMLGAASSLWNKGLDASTGLLWGLAGFATFFVSPSLGLAPELPGTTAAYLQSRQLWWIATVICTGTGFALLAFAPHYLLKLAGLVVLVLPHLFGAPQPVVHSALAPHDLITSFIIATAIANAVFWVALGSSYGFFSHKMKAI